MKVDNLIKKVEEKEHELDALYKRDAQLELEEATLLQKFKDTMNARFEIESASEQLDKEVVHLNHELLVEALKLRNLSYTIFDINERDRMVVALHNKDIASFNKIVQTKII